MAKLKLIENWMEVLLKAWSVRLSLLAGIVAGYLYANPDDVQKLLNIVPEGPWRVVASVGLGIIITALTTGTRLVSQVKPPKQEEDQ